jgi:hypothetical protein
MLVAQTIFIQCLNFTNDEHFIPQGVHSINVPPSCKAALPCHVIFSDVLLIRIGTQELQMDADQGTVT